MIIDIQKIAHITNPSTTHVYIKPHPLLMTSIAHYTYMYEEEIKQQTPYLDLVPDAAGCIVLQQTEQKFECIFWGGTTQCVRVTSDTKQIRFRLFVEFLPTGAFSFLHHQQNRYLNQQIPLDVIHPTLFQEIAYVYEDCVCLSQFIACLDTIFLQHWKGKLACVTQIQKHLHEGKTVLEIMEDIGYSRRHIQRMFQEQMGCTMKQYQRIERTNQSVIYLQQESYSIAQIAQMCGFYDEAHFIHDFTSIMNVSPKTYQNQMSNFYNEIFKF